MGFEIAGILALGYAFARLVAWCNRKVMES